MPCAVTAVRPSRHAGCSDGSPPGASPSRRAGGGPISRGSRAASDSPVQPPPSADHSVRSRARIASANASRFPRERFVTDPRGEGDEVAWGRLGPCRSGPVEQGVARRARGGVAARIQHAAPRRGGVARRCGRLRRCGTAAAAARAQQCPQRRQPRDGQDPAETLPERIARIGRSGRLRHTGERGPGRLSGGRRRCDGQRPGRDPGGARRVRLDVPPLHAQFRKLQLPRRARHYRDALDALPMHGVAAGAGHDGRLVGIDPGGTELGKIERRKLFAGEPHRAESQRPGHRLARHEAGRILGPFLGEGHRAGRQATASRRRQGGV